MSDYQLIVIGAGPGGYTAALVNGLTVGQLLSVMRPHPSFEEAMTEALERLAEKL